MKIGFLCNPVAGHLHPMTALGRRLQARGHEVVFAGIPDAAACVRAAGLGFLPYGEDEFPPDSRAMLFGRVAHLSGFDVLRHTIEEPLPLLTQAMFQHLPGKLAGAGIEALVIDTTCYYAELVAMSLDLPFVHVWCILNVDGSGATPPSYYGWPLEPTEAARERNVEGLKRVAALGTPLVLAATAFAERAGLDVDCSDSTANQSKLAVISQTPAVFDYPGIPWPAEFHYTGPFHDDEGRAAVPFPWEALDERPLIYASLGTMVNGQRWIYRTIFGALEQLPEVQVVLASGTNVDPDTLGPIPSNTMVVPVAPQLELLGRASLCLTHAGLNTTLEALARGVPLVAIPIGFEQPGIAARIAHHGVGERMVLDDLTAAGLAGLVRRVLGDPSYQIKAREFRAAIAATNGLEAASDLVERAFGVEARAGVRSGPILPGRARSA